jgi:biotin operon repressor
MATEIDLDSLFRRSSKARVVAERLLTGRQQTREELVDGLALSMTTVPRVVEALENAGVRIERTTDRSRKAAFRVLSAGGASVDDPAVGKVLSRFTRAGSDTIPVSVTKVEFEHGTLWVEWDCEPGHFRGRVLDAEASLPQSLLSGSGTVTELCLLSSGAVAWRLGDERHATTVGEVTRG